MRVVIAILVLGIACLLLALDVHPVPTWFYVFAWYPLLVVADEVLRRRSGRRWLTDPGRAASLFGWSVVIWMGYELVNFRIQNWYYVFLPTGRAGRWLGVAVSFATVVPAIVLGEQLLASFRAQPADPSRTYPTRSWHLHASVGLGLLLLVLTLSAPRLFSPLVWGAGLLIADPLVYRRCPDASLLRDLEHGRWSRIGRLMLTGLLIGFLWEGLNFWARAKWVYTVPHLEAIKWFEMPPFGFVGFPVFALSAWSLYHAVCALGWGVPVYGEAPLRTVQLRFVGPIALLVCAATLWGMDRWTVSSVSPRLDALTDDATSIQRRLADQGIDDLFKLADYDSGRLAERTGLSPLESRQLVESARLATTRGIGVEHERALRALGIRDLCDLARANTADLWRDIHARSDGLRPTPAEVRVWVRAAQRRCPGA
jgi:Domain of unknown function (DUF4332)